MQFQEQTLRSGFFDKDAFRQKKKTILVLKTAIAGLQFHVNQNSEEGQKLLDSLTPGTELHMFRDADNKHDEWAIEIFTTDDKELGYVTKFKNETIARLMDCGKVFYAFVDEQPKDDEEIINHAYTEDYRVPFSIYMED